MVSTSIVGRSQLRVGVITSERFIRNFRPRRCTALCQEGQSNQEGKDAAPGAPAQALAPGGARLEGKSGGHQRRAAGAQLSALRLAGVALPDLVPVQPQKITSVTPEVSSNFTSTAGSLQPSCLGCGGFSPEHFCCSLLPVSVVWRGARFSGPAAFAP